jgi:hypothetical protein
VRFCLAGNFVPNEIDFIIRKAAQLRVKKIWDLGETGVVEYELDSL